ncbi:ubiquinone/menaquinone biosynthesis C-methylase UbiE [Pedobacter sp. UYP30]|uniref:class I SAM-dependent methyltransferase n=1 Tax=Pedobacter sp. UYP30 TaxID=1756400 RepID=UPI0033952D67
MNRDLATYYEQRAKEYERVYAKPERKEDLKRSTMILQELLANKTVLEIACGTGYWTEKIAQTATSILATDVGKKVLEVARAKKISTKKVTFLLSDLFELNFKNEYESLFGGFIWSHILLQNIQDLLKKVNELVLPGGTVVFMDNNFVQGSSRPISQTDKVGNTYQTRKLENG